MRIASEEVSLPLGCLCSAQGADPTSRRRVDPSDHLLPPTANDTMASPSTAAPTVDEQAEAEYRALELKFFKSRHPSSARHHAEWVRAKERYHELRLEYLEVCFLLFPSRRVSN